MRHDQEQLAIWLNGRASLEEVSTTPAIGVNGNRRFSERARRRFATLWTWGSPRYEGAAGAAQERYCKVHGHAALYRRFDRCRRIAERIASRSAPPTVSSSSAPGGAGHLPRG